MALGIQRALHQADFLLQEQHFQQVAHGFGVADDVVANRLVAKARTHFAGFCEDGQFGSGVGRVLGTVHTQGPRIIQQAQQQGALGRLVQALVARLDAGRGQQLGHHFLVLVRALAQIDGGQVKAKHLHGADQRVQALGGEGAAVVGL
jgi:hypothetical protein